MERGVSEKARFMYLNEIAQVYVDEHNEIFDVDAWRNGNDKKITAIEKRISIKLGKTYFDSDDDEILIDLTATYFIRKKETLRREIAHESAQNEALIEMGAQIDDLKNQHAELKREFGMLAAILENHTKLFAHSILKGIDKESSDKFTTKKMRTEFTKQQ